MKRKQKEIEILISRINNLLEQNPWLRNIDINYFDWIKKEASKEEKRSKIRKLQKLILPLSQN